MTQSPAPAGPPPWDGSEPHPGTPPWGGAAPAAEPVVVRIGELAVTSSTVHTPAGAIPLRGSTWLVSDQWLTEQRIPRWAIVLAVVGFCLLTFFSLFFLLARETVYRGTAQVTVSNGPLQYVARIPLESQADLHGIHQAVNYARSLAAL
jgi:hypothetical protein